jgi:ribosomal peptide maturation radical SAM protein 1
MGGVLGPGAATSLRVMLVAMPFASIDRPALGVSTLKAALESAGIECRALYLNVAFAERVGEPDYSRFCADLPHASLVGEWVFAECLNGADPIRDAEYVRRVLEGTWRLPKDDLGIVRRLRSAASGFLDACLASHHWSEFDVVGFSSFCAQNTASLALARMIKDRHRRVLVAFGGHNWEGPMGRELLRRFPFVDVAFSGPADVSFPTFLRRVQRGDSSWRGIAGLVSRGRAVTNTSPKVPLVEDLDALPLPDHSDYFDALGRSTLSKAVQPVVSVETARGCWWAAGKPCLFCGLNGSSRSFRSKSPDRILHELRWLSDRWPGLRLVFVDNVVSPGFMSNVLPRLVAERLGSPISFMVRCNIGREEVRLTKEADGSLRSGVESLNANLLRLMGKGTTVLENVRLMKWCMAYGVDHRWNLLFACPGETAKDYRDIIEMLPSLRFLDPPDGCAPLIVERFSRYFEDPSGYGFGQVEPLEAYSFVYPFPKAALRRIAYFFDHEYRPVLGTRLYIERLRAEVEQWRARGACGCLRKEEDLGGGLTLVDTRDGDGVVRHRLEGMDDRLYEACDDIGKLSDLYELARVTFGGKISIEEVDQRLSSFVERRLMIREDDRYLSLALPEGGLPDETLTADPGQASPEPSLTPAR